MQTFSMTDTGRARQSNQDSVFCEENGVGKFPNLFIVADGMGGHNAGDIASKIGIEEAVRQIKASEKVTPVGILEEAVQSANACIYENAEKNERFKGMGTTMVATTVIGETAYVVNVGDSRLYLLNDVFRQITEDHSLVEEMVRSGEIQKEEMRTHPNKNIITHALGSNEAVLPDCFEIQVNPGYVLLLCSDGLSNMLDDETIENTIRKAEGKVDVAGKELIDLANEAGGKDNISVILVQL